MAETKTMTGAKAIVRVNGVQIGLMRSIGLTETITRERVAGLGHILPEEYPVTSWEGRANAGLFLVTIRNSPFQTNIRRDLADRSAFEDYLIIGEDEIQIDIFKKISTQRDANGEPIIVPEILASIRGVRMESEAFQINDGAVATRDVGFVYTEPLLYTV